jgi:hypothetical protein
MADQVKGVGSYAVKGPLSLDQLVMPSAVLIVEAALRASDLREADYAQPVPRRYCNMVRAQGTSAVDSKPRRSLRCTVHVLDGGSVCFSQRAFGAE